jgi:hypothetical protein
MRWLIAPAFCLALLTPAASPCSAQPGGLQPAGGVAGGPQTYRSRSFVLHTDLSADESQELLGRLETMLRLISAYWGQPNKQVIEMYVAKDIAAWPADVLGRMDPDGVNQIRIGAGVTTGRTRIVGANRFTKSIVYATADHGTPQHEAVHAYCQQTFGTCGPLWYAEGMAEMGQYWKKDDASVHCAEEVLRYLQATRPKSLGEIVNPQQEFTGDSWENYAWRWALCHLLANNPNYSPRFRPLGLGLLAERDVSFEQTYGTMAEEIIFEYLFFLDHIEPGYRVDLCAWDWKATFEEARRTNIVRSEIEAARGWQPTRARLVAGKQYDFSASGSWRLEPKGDALTADGAASTEAAESSAERVAVGPGRLVGVLFKDHKLGEPFALEAYGTFTAPGDGDL